MAQGLSACEAGLQESLAPFSGASPIRTSYPSLLREALFHHIGFDSCRLFENIFGLTSIHLALLYVHLPLGSEVRCSAGQCAFTDCTISLQSAGKAPPVANSSSQGRAPGASFRREKLVVREGLLWILCLSF